MEALTPNDWEYYIISLRGRNILTKTFKRYLGETKKLLRYFRVSHEHLDKYKENQNPLKRAPILKPKKEYCALEWDQIQRICEMSRTAKRRKNDNTLGRTILTLGFTTGARIGSLLPPRYGERKEKHVPITRSNIRLVGEQFHIWQPISKTDREGRGRLIVVSPTNCKACPVRCIRHLLWFPTDKQNRLFSNGLGVATSN